MSSKPFHIKEVKLVVHRRFLCRLSADNQINLLPSVTEMILLISLSSLTTQVPIQKSLNPDSQRHRRDLLPRALATMMN